MARTPIAERGLEISPRILHSARRGLHFDEFETDDAADSSAFDPALKHAFSYASADDPLHRRMVIRAIETATGQRRLYRKYLEYRRNPVPGACFWEEALNRLDIALDYDEGRLAAAPARGPLVMVANHPFGVVDGLIVGLLASRLRTEFKVLTNAVLYKAPELRPNLLPIDMSESVQAVRTNLRSRQQATGVLNRGGAVAVFPAGGVATARRKSGRGPAIDPQWRPFTASLIARSRATVLPVYFEGQNSWLFQFASQFSATFRLSLLMKEVADRMGTRISLRIGDPIPWTHLAGLPGRQAQISYLRKTVHALGATWPNGLAA